MGFHPVAVVGKIVHKQKINNCIHGEKQYTKHYKNLRVHKIEKEHNIYLICVVSRNLHRFRGIAEVDVLEPDTSCPSGLVTRELGSIR